MPLYDFGCENGHRYEGLRPPDTRAEPCEVCGGQACRVYGYKAAIVGTVEPDLRGMFRRYSEATLEMSDLADRRGRETGETIQGHRGPSPWKIAKRRAAAFSRAGEVPVIRS